MKLVVDGVVPDELAAIPGLSVVAQEGKDITILFASETGLEECRARLERLATGRAAIRKDLLWAINGVRYVTPEDRTGPALLAEGTPESRCRLDVELWPLDLATERDQMLRNFREWSVNNGVVHLDRVNNEAVVLMRVETEPVGVGLLLNHRDVRQVDLPPRYQLDFSVLRLDVAHVPTVTPAGDGAPGVVVLDSGVTTNHPLLGPFVGDAQGFCGDEDDGHDTTGHGTMVAGLALYGNLEASLERETLDPKLRLFSGRIADASGSEPSELLENRILKAVDYFLEHYGCRVFNLSFGDLRKPYRGAHVDRLAATLDTIAHEKKVLFVVSTGNFSGGTDGPEDWRREYPRYLLQDAARLLDPAPALNVLTVGSIARLETSRLSATFPQDPAHQPIARAGEPSPFTRAGPGPLGAIKPELVEFGGNQFVDTRTANQAISSAALGEVSTSIEFASGRLFTADHGTSYAAPRVANAAALILTEYGEASANALRALLVAHAVVPEAAAARFAADEGELLRLVGYGAPQLDPSLYSLESRVTMVAEEALGPNQHHFYEVPLPEDFFVAPVRRPRRLRVAVSHMPAVRRTRLDYRQAKLTFRIVRAGTLAEVTQAYRRLRAGEEERSIPESDFSPGPQARDGGTVQAATRILRQVDTRTRQRPYFVVVTHQVPAWVSAPEAEPYSLVLVVEDLSGAEVRLYSQIREELRVRARARARA